MQSLLAMRFSLLHLQRDGPAEAGHYDYHGPAEAGHYFFGATIFVTRPTLVSPAYRLSCLSITQ